MTPWREVLTGVVGRMTAEMDDPVRRRVDGATSRDSPTSSGSGSRRSPRRSARSTCGRRPASAASGSSRTGRSSRAGRSRSARRRSWWTTTPWSRADPGAVCELALRADRLVVLLGDRRLEMPAWVEPGDAPARATSTRTASSRSATSRRALPDPASRAVLVRRLDPRRPAHDPRRTLSPGVSTPRPAIAARCGAWRRMSPSPARRRRSGIGC